MRGSEVITEILAHAGVNLIYSLSGNQIMPIYDACIDQKIKIIHTRHEGAAVFMAESHAQLVDSFGVALVAAAPGFGNALGALYSALMSQTPLLFLSGDSPVSGDNTGTFQEFPQCEAISPFVKSSVRVTDIDQLQTVIYSAISTALSEPQGPVHIALPEDILLTDTNAPSDKLSSGNKVSETEHQNKGKDILQHLDQASQALILTGPEHNASRQGVLLKRLENALNVPVVCIESPRGLKDPALGAVAEKIAESDLILYLGKKVNFQTGFATEAVMPKAQLILTHPDSNEIIRATDNLQNRVVFSLSAGTVDLAEQLISSAEEFGFSKDNARTQWLVQVKKAIHCRDFVEKTQPITPAQLVRAVNSTLCESPNTILVCDGGEFGQWAHAFADADKRVINGASGAIGGSIPYAIAASISHPDSRVIAFLGDGTAGFHLAEFETAVRAKSNPVFVIGNDSRWNAEYQIQLNNYGKDRLIACELGDRVDYAACMEALGGVGYNIDTLEALETTLQSLHEDQHKLKVPVCLNVQLQGEPAPTFKLMKNS